MSEFENRKFMIVDVSEISLIDFSEVLQTSENTLRKSVDGTKTLVKWDGDSIPTSVNLLTTKEGPYTYSEILNIMSTPEWYQILPN